MKDYYDILGISKNASDSDIKRAYRKLAQEHHPDRNKGDKKSEEQFKKINEAYEVLSDSQKRKQYDQFGSAGTSFGGGSPFEGFQGSPFDFGSFAGGSGFADIFETFFGTRRGETTRTGPLPGEHVEISMRILFEEAVFGTTKNIVLDTWQVCERCKGNQAEPGTKIVSCDACKGRGEIRVTQRTVLGTISTSRICDACGGLGKMPQTPCTACDGEGRMRREKTVSVNIPPGVSDGMTLRIRGKGHAGERGGDTGDLFIHVSVQPHKTFRREGSDVYSDVVLSITQLVLGDVVSVETLHGPVQLKIPGGTQTGKVFRIKHNGIPVLHGRSGARGDHYVRVTVRIPEKLSQKERELFQALHTERFGDGGESPSFAKDFLKKFRK